MQLGYFIDPEAKYWYSLRLLAFPRRASTLRPVG